MTSQLNVDTIVDKAGSGGTNVKVANTSTYVSEGGAVTQNTVQGIAKCWVKFDPTALSGTGTTGVGDSFNLTSMTDNGSGSHTITINNDMSSANYSTPTAPNADYTSGGVGVYAGAKTHATGSFIFVSKRNNASADSDYGGVTVHGDLA